MPNADAVAGQVVAADVPVLFLDTCILLDIIRSTHRGHRDYAERAGHLLGHLSATPPACLLVVASIVPHEWSKHAQEVTAETKTHLARIEDQSGHFHDACRAFGIVPGFGRAAYAGVGLERRLEALSRSLLGAAIVLDADDESSGRAVRRVVHNVPPSRKGGQVQDCTIIEEYLAVCRRLSRDVFARKRAFCTSNTSDYCQTGTRPHSNLAADCLAVDLTFTTNLTWALHEIGI